MTRVPAVDGAQTPEPVWVDGIVIRLLAASESARLGDAIRAVYGDTYPIRWTYDADEVARRIGAGLLISAIAETGDGELLCHSGLTLSAPDDVVGHGGQAVTLPAAQGRHIFTKVKQYVIDWATTTGLVGMYSEAMASHPYSERALLDLGGHETGFMLGFSPGSVDDSISGQSEWRQSAALFYLRLRSGHERVAYAPERHRAIVRDTIEICDLRARLAAPPADTDAELPAASLFEREIISGDNVAILTVRVAGSDLTSQIDRARARLFDNGVDALYVDLPLEQPETAHLGDALEELKLSYSGIFPNNHAAGDVLRLQCLRNAAGWSHDVAVASPHGAALLEYVVADMEAVGQPVMPVHAHPAAAPATTVPLVTSH